MSNENKIMSSGGFIPSVANTPLDLRTRVQTINDIYNIELPYVGMLVYVIDEDKYYKIKTLKNKVMGAIILKDLLVDTFEVFSQGAQESQMPDDPSVPADVTALQQEVIRLRSALNELVQPPEIVFANRNIISEMEYLNEKTQNSDIVGVIIDPQISVINGEDNFKLNISLEFVNNKIDYFDSIIVDKIKSIDNAILKLEENNVYNVNSENLYYKEDPEAKVAGFDCWNTESLLERSVNHLANQTIEFNCLKQSNGESISLEQGHNLIQKVKNNETEMMLYFIFNVSLASHNNATSFAKTIEIPYSTKINY